MLTSDYPRAPRASLSGFYLSHGVSDVFSFPFPENFTSEKLDNKREEKEPIEREGGEKRHV